MGRCSCQTDRVKRLPLVLAMVFVLGLSAPAAASVASAAPIYCTVKLTFTAAQVIWVDGSGSRQTTRLCARVSPGRYVVQRGPYAGHVGRLGVAAPGAKREGDGKTPYGSYPMRGGFGIHANPGLASSWLETGSRDVWVDDSRSRLYNTHQRTPVNGRWASAERMRVSPAYNYAQVIGYNEARTPWRGSAIFLHVDQGRGTAGCVSLSTASLLAVLRWQKPGAWIWITQ
jgi:L,D-peptidoglycan transpeptidase YkuD (ErfK/YbiS/YcfS/YnhG family)